MMCCCEAAVHTSICDTRTRMSNAGRFRSRWHPFTVTTESRAHRASRTSSVGYGGIGGEITRRKAIGGRSTSECRRRRDRRWPAPGSSFRPTRQSSILSSCSSACCSAGGERSAGRRPRKRAALREIDGPVLARAETLHGFDLVVESGVRQLNDVECMRTLWNTEPRAPVARCAVATGPTLPRSLSSFARLFRSIRYRVS
jgi:hypothetical protein